MPDKKIPYVYDQRLNGGRGGYRDTTTGRAISKTVFNSWRDETIRYQQQAAKDLTSKVMSGEINLQRWERDLRQIIKDTHGMLYAAGKGGYNNMTPADWGRVGAEVKQQYAYLSNFRNDIASGRLTVGQAMTRAGMYPGSANQAWEKARTANIFDPRKLPAYPGDGTTICRTNCRCSWEIKEIETGWLAYWRLGYAEHCPDCVQRAGQWSPITIMKDFG